jgi:hypothetical protein
MALLPLKLVSQKIKNPNMIKIKHSEHDHQQQELESGQSGSW